MGHYETEKHRISKGKITKSRTQQQGAGCCKHYGERSIQVVQTLSRVKHVPRSVCRSRSFLLTVEDLYYRSRESSGKFTALPLRIKAAIFLRAVTDGNVGNSFRGWIATPPHFLRSLLQFFQCVRFLSRKSAPRPPQRISDEHTQPSFSRGHEQPNAYSAEATRARKLQQSPSTARISNSYLNLTGSSATSCFCAPICSAGLGNL